MSKLIGTDPNQVPSNADLGSAAFMDAKDFLTARGSNLSAIDAIVQRTAVDVFVYDTSKDSDGGAWRKRTQSTSWYNEKLNTPIRGSRQEFPSVAVIVATAASGGETKVIIYDADDPTLPMWMELSARGNTHAQGPTTLGWYTSGTPLLTAVTALNGIVGVVGDGGLRQVKFVSDSFRIGYTTNSYRTHVNIAQREFKDVINEGSDGNGGDIICWYETNDLDMTVFPNAPIDASTGLSTPTIVLATQNGISVIQNDGTVINRAAAESPANYAHSIVWDGSSYIYGEHHSSVGHASAVRRAGYDVTASLGGIHNESQDRYLSNLYWAKFKKSYSADSAATDYAAVNASEDDYFKLARGGNVGSSKGITKALSPKSIRQMPYGPPHTTCYIMPTYNTGWMGGDIRLATMSDTETTTIPSETNGITAGSTVSGATGAITTGITSSAASNIMFTVPVSMTVGKQYTIAMQRETGSDSFTRIYGPWPTQHAIDYTYTGTGSVVTHSFHATSNGSAINFVGSGAGSQMKASSIVIREAVADRSWNGYGCRTHGTVNRDVVATGAELVGYSFTGVYTNYLSQEYRSQLDFGTGSMTISVWVKRDSGSALRYVLCRGTADATETIRLGIKDSGVYFDYGNGAAYTETNDLFPNGRWVNVLCTVSAGAKGRVYVNGVEQAYAVNNVSPNPIMNAANYTSLIGRHYDNNNDYAFSGDIALLRLYGTVPSDEQIADMYNDEKQLFRENAKATLYGTSSAIKALAYDGDTELLHAGTTSGTSVFQGLTRINNTTDAVNVSLSAANGLVAEE